MGMTAGTASADPVTGAITGTDLALALALALYTYFTAGYSSAQLNYQNPVSSPPGVFVYKVGAATAACGMATALAAGLVPYIQANAVAVIGTALGGLQKSTSAGTLTDPIGGLIPVELPIS